MWYVGVDVHARLFWVCILNQNGKVVKEMKIQGGLCDLLNVLKKIHHPLAVCFEASCGYGHVYDLLAGVAQRVVVAHPGQLRLIFKSKRKNDRVDAKKLAMLLMLDQVPAVHVPDVNVREWRGLIEFRVRLVSDRTQAKNRLRSLYRQYGVALPSGKRLWTKKGTAAVSHEALPTPAACVRRDLLVDQLQRLGEQIARLERELKIIADGHPAVGLLRSIPGVGPRTAEAVVAYVDQPRRFHRNKCIGSYFGLVPCQDQSADRNRLGHITREGPATVRKFLTEAAWQGVRRSATLRRYFERIQGGDPQRKRIALIATAHHLLRIMLSMLKSGERWRQETMQTKAA
jgi:transposase